MKKNKDKFEENYFEDYYKGIGDFTKKSDKQLKNWFKGMFDFISNYYPVKNGNGKKVIEFGCATGVSSELLREFGYEVTATDISQYAIKRAKKNYQKVYFLVHDLQKPFVKKNHFDLAIAFDVIEHLDIPEKAIKNIYNILKKGGAAIFSTPNDYKHISNDPTHINVKTPDEWKRIIKQAGFRNIVVKQVTFVPYLFRLHWRLNYAFPLATASQYFISPVFIVAKK